MKRDERLLLVAFGLLTAFLIGELVAAAIAQSLALLADAGHMATDVLAILAAIIAARLARRPAVGHWTFGLARAEVLAAAVNGITLVVVAVIVTIQAIRRLVNPVEVGGRALIIVALAGLAINLVVTAVLTRADRRSINVAAVVAHVLTDAYAFAATIVAGTLVVTTGWNRADPVASLLVVVLLIRAARELLMESGRVLLEAAPTEVDLALVRQHLLEAPNVVDLHDLHVWTVTSGLPALSVHVVIADDCFTNGQVPALLDELQACLAGHFDVEHSTFQLEPAGHSDHEAATHR
jgi:cobalt-zinc-cadmium efflux system protein